jgi:hypothetical protein
MFQLVLPAQGEIGPSVGSDIVNVEAVLDDGKVVYADMQFEYICEGLCYFKSTIIRFARLPFGAALTRVGAVTVWCRYWWIALTVSLIIAVILFYLGFRCPSTPPPPSTTLPTSIRSPLLPFIIRRRSHLRNKEMQSTLAVALTRQDHGVTQLAPPLNHSTLQYASS